MPDVATLQTDTLWLAVVVAVLALVTTSLGLFSLATGKDHWPKRWRRLRRRTPASEEDHRRQGIIVMLNSGMALIIVLGTSTNALGAQDRSVGEPLNTLRFALTSIGALVAIALAVGAYCLSLRMRYTDGRSAQASPVEPSI